MGSLGCKYCNCDRARMEDAKEEMKIQYNNPIVLTNENKKKENNENNKNDENNKENIMNNNDDLNNIEINNNNLNQTPLLNSSQLKDNNNLINQNSKILVNDDNTITPIKENVICLNNINNNENNNDDDKNNDNNNINKIITDNKLDNNNDYNNLRNSNNEQFIIEENNSEINNSKKKNSELKENKINQFSITNTREAKNKIKKYEINKIQFGLEKEDKENLNKEQQKLYNEAETNLQQFYPPQGNEISQIQTIMTNILLYKLKNILAKIDLNSNLNEQHDILLNGNLKKMINYEINAHNPTMYSERFCILYPKMFKYYKSQAQFLKNLQASCILPINQISGVNIAKPKKGKNKFYHLILCNKFGIRKSINNNIFLNLFDSTEVNDYLTSPELNESLLIFSSDEEQDIYKWYIIIQYLIEFSKQ